VNRDMRRLCAGDACVHEHEMKRIRTAIVCAFSTVLALMGRPIPVTHADNGARLRDS
jgi:hypothetical protein